VDKFGGPPWGLDPAAWPRCSACGGVQTHLAQLSHHPEHLDLGEPGRALLLFMCYHVPGGCPTWEAGAGADARLILDAHQVGVGLTPPPGEELTALEAVVVDWIEKDDGIPPERYAVSSTSRSCTTHTPWRRSARSPTTRSRAASLPRGGRPRRDRRRPGDSRFSSPRGRLLRPPAGVGGDRESGVLRDWEPMLGATPRRAPPAVREAIPVEAARLVADPPP